MFTPVFNMLFLNFYFNFYYILFHLASGQKMMGGIFCPASVSEAPPPARWPQRVTTAENKNNSILKFPAGQIKRIKKTFSAGVGSPQATQAAGLSSAAIRNLL